MTSREQELLGRPGRRLRRRAGPRAARPAGARRLAEPAAVASLPPIPGRVADLGCGTGTLSLLLAEEGYAVDGVDFSPEMVRRATAKAGSFPGTSFVVGDAADPPLRGGAYDVVLCRHVLWALPDPAAALARWVELLAPGGRLVLVEGSWSTGAGLTAGRDGRAGRGTPGCAADARAARRPGVLGRADHRRALRRWSAGACA